jgi:hypothetical protein
MYASFSVSVIVVLVFDDVVGDDARGEVEEVYRHD